MANTTDACDVQHQLNAAITSADVTAILILLDDPSLDLNARDRGHDLQTPLMRMCHMAVEPEVLCTILEKLEHCAWNPNMQDATGRNLLMHGCIADKIDVVDMCLANGCDVSLVDRDGNSAIVYAIRSGNESMLGLIVDHEECLYLLTQTNNTGHTPIEVAQVEGHVSMVNLLSSLLPSQHTNNNRKSKVKGQKSDMTPRNRRLKRQDSLKHHILETNGLPNTGRVERDRYISECDNGLPTHRSTNAKHQRKFSDIVMHHSLATDDHVTRPLEIADETYDDRTRTDMTSDSDHVSARNAAEKRHKTSLEMPAKSKKTQRLLQRETEDCGQADDKSTSTLRNKPLSKQLLFCRKDSTSLPDLRDFKGKLVTSGDVTPTDPTSTSFDKSEEGRSGGGPEGDDDAFVPSESYLELYQKTASSCSLPPLLSNSADSDRRKERGAKHGARKAKKTTSHEDVLMRSLIV